MDNLLRDNPPVFAAWQRARRVERYNVSGKRLGLPLTLLLRLIWRLRRNIWDSCAPFGV